VHVADVRHDFQAATEPDDVRPQRVEADLGALLDLADPSLRQSGGLGQLHLGEAEALPEIRQLGPVDRGDHVVPHRPPPSDPIRVVPRRIHRTSLLPHIPPLRGVTHRSLP
jgi:hypothetical protein